jgi:hypothetical protein
MARPSSIDEVISRSRAAAFCLPLPSACSPHTG